MAKVGNLIWLNRNGWSSWKKSTWLDLGSEVGFKASRTWDGASLTSSSLQHAKKGIRKEKRLRLDFRLGRGTVHSAFKGEPFPSSLCDIEITISSRSRHWPFPTHHQIMSREGLRLPPFCDFGFPKQKYQRKGGLGSKPRHRLGDNLNPGVYLLSETRWMWQKKERGFRSPLRTLTFYARERLSSVGKNDWCASMRICACSPTPIQKSNHYSGCNPGAAEEERR